MKMCVCECMCVCACTCLCVLRGGFDDQIWMGGLLKLGNGGETKASVAVFVILF